MKHKESNSIFKLIVWIVVIFIFVYIAVRSNVDVNNEVVDVLPASTVDTDSYTELRYETLETTYVSTAEIAETTEPPTTEIIEATEPPTTEAEEMLDSYISTLYSISHEDSQMLVRLAMAEAGNQDIYGKALVMVVVLNRVQDSQFPDTISEVIMQENQFTPVSNGVFYEVEPDDECYEALNWVMLQGWDESQGALYFESCSNADNWHSRNLEYLFIHGDHRFYK